MKKLLLACFILLASLNLPAQRLTHLWDGLKSRQPQSELPKGNAPYQVPLRKAKINEETLLEPVKKGEWIIAKGWELSESTPIIVSEKSIFDTDYSTSQWYNATVPGTVLTTLVNQGVYSDPYFGLNNMYIPDTLSRMDWWYRVPFDLPADAKGKNIRLLFNGINYKAEIFLNAKKIGDIQGAFIRGDFDITNILKADGKNILAIHILPPNNPGIPHEQSMVAGQGLNGGQLSLDGPTFISSVGWDWIPGIRDRNIGIWQDVKLVATDEVIIKDPLIITDLPLPDTTTAKITFRTDVKNLTNKAVSGVLTAQLEGMNVKVPYTLNANEEKTLESSFTLNKPKLWWPNGYGNQHLYNMQFTAKNGNNVSSIETVRFGVREMSYELMVGSKQNGNYRVEYNPLAMGLDGKPVFDYDNRIRLEEMKFFIPALQAGVDESKFIKIAQDDPVAPYFVIKVNGTRIFCRGGNWGMDDGMKRSAKERLEPYLRLHKDAGFNMVRNWTGESTNESFYALCDEYGMLVWNDFWITTDDTVEPNDFELFMRNATDAVKRFRNHPSIAVWGPRNEGFAPRGLSEMLTNMMAKEDPTRHYHGQSRFLNMGTSGPWGYFKDPSLYYTQNAQGFNTEMGSFAIPTANTIKKFIAPQDQWPINDVWAYHDMHHTSQNFPDFMAAVSRYGEPTGLDDFAKKAQFICYDAWRNMLEAWNSKMWNNTTGLVLWMSHPAWPSMIWQTYTYDYETPGSYFGAKKACEPVHIQMNLPDNDVVVINTTRTAYKSLDAVVTYYDANGKQLHKEQKKVNADTNKLTKCFTPTAKSLPDIYLVRLELKDKNKVISQNDYWQAKDNEAYKQLNNVGQATVAVKSVKNANGKYTFEVENTSAVPAMAVKLTAQNKAGEVILPAYFSDGYFNLMPKEKRMIVLDIPEHNGFSIGVEAYNVAAKTGSFISK